MKDRINVVLVALALIGGAAIFGHSPVNVVEAQNAGRSMIDSWSGLDDSTQTFTGTVGTTAAAIVTAVSGKAINVRAVQSMSMSSAGIVSLIDGASGAVLGQYYLAANTPFQITESEMGRGPTTTAGNGLYALSNVAATLTITERIQKK